METVTWIDPRAWPIDWSGSTATLALVDCDALAAAPNLGPMPPFPIVGIGRPGAACDRLDAIVPDEAAAGQLAYRISSAPKAAAVAVQLLRTIEGLPPEQALTIESLAFAMLQGSDEFAGWLARQPARAANPRAEIAHRLQIERHGATLALTLDRPDARNAIDAAMRDALNEAFTVAALDPAIERITLGAVGRCFSIGGELAEFGTTSDPAEAHRIRCLTLPARALLPRASACEVHVRGACIGAGIELAAFAALVTATPDAWFQLPELAMGLIPGAGGCVSVPRRIGRQRTALMLLTGRRIDAATALDWGLVDQIMPDTRTE